MTISSISDLWISWTDLHYYECQGLGFGGDIPALRSITGGGLRGSGATATNSLVDLVSCVTP